jgi:hypothetical protein
MSQEEIDLARQYASQWPLLNTSNNPLRQLVSRSTYRAYIGERTVDSFIDLFKVLATDEPGDFSNKNIDIRLYFINSLKTQDVNLECMEETKTEDETTKIATRKANLIAMLKGAIVSTPKTKRISFVFN